MNVHGRRTAVAVLESLFFFFCASFLVAFFDGEDEEEESDPVEGLEPHEIAALVAKEAPDGDVYAGWSPEEIQEYEEKSRREREKEKKGVFEMPPNVVSKK